MSYEPKPNTQIRDLSDNELLEEYKYWDNKIISATSWGASIAAANRFRKDCETQIKLRNLTLSGTI